MDSLLSITLELFDLHTYTLTAVLAYHSHACLSTDVMCMSSRCCTWGDVDTWACSHHVPAYTACMTLASSSMCVHDMFLHSVRLMYNQH